MATAHLFTRASTGPFAIMAAAVALVMFGAPGCGGDDDNNGGGDPQRFIGTWTASSGSLAATCPGLPVPADDLTGEKLTVTAGTDAPIEAELSGCKIKFDIKGDVATARPNQTCSIVYPTAAGALNASLTVAAASFTLKGTSGDFTQNGNATVMINIPLLPSSASCTYTIMATAARM